MVVVGRKNAQKQKFIEPETNKGWESDKRGEGRGRETLSKGERLTASGSGEGQRD